MENVLKDRNRTILLLAAFALLNVVLWQIPGGKFFLYPFTILGTWFHEMGHGLTAMIMGGGFYRLEIYADGSGLAQHGGSLYLGNLGKALVAAGGPVGPTIAGSLFILLSRKADFAKYTLLTLSIILFISVIFWVRSIFGIIVILLFAVGIFYIFLKGKDKIHSLALQFLGIQAFVSVYQSLGYFFSSGAVVDGKEYLADTAVIAENLLLPYWFWAGSIMLFSILVIFLSFKFLLRIKPEQNKNEILL